MQESDQPLLFSLKVELINSENNISDTQLFERTLFVRYLKETGRDSTFYNAELKMHFQDISAIAYLYEIETAEFQVTNSKRLSKAAEFLRRTNYVYDWIQIKINAKGKLLSIENKQELKERWKRLRSSILADYKGGVVEHALMKIDKRLETEDNIWSAIYQYFHFGLLFPHIPQFHDKDWENKRIIEFSEYENEKFEEHIVYEKTEDNLRTYKISGESLSDSQTIIERYEGRLSVPKGNVFPESVEVCIIFKREDITNRWNFKLFRYN